MKLPKIKFGRVTLDGASGVQVTVTVGGIALLLSLSWSKGAAQ